jgi:hypothetical protein
MSDIVPKAPNTIPALTAEAIDRVRRLEEVARVQPQTPIETQHVFHAGLYARTVMIPAGHMITGALIKIPTILIVSGNAVMYGADGSVEVSGYTVFSASAGRKQAMVALTDTHLTMLFPTEAKTVDEAERAFTDEFDLLITRKESAPCQA